MLLVYNANGREISSYDSRPSALAARELLLRGTLDLNEVVAATPEYGRRWGFILARDGRYRSIYSPVPAIVAAAITWPFWRAGIVDLTAPFATQAMAKITASAFVALAVVFAYLTARVTAGHRVAVLVAVGLGLGTGYWSSASQTLWQMETALAGLSIAVFALVRRRADSGSTDGAVMGAGLALAAAARPQLAPAVAILLVALLWRAPRTVGIIAALIVGIAASLLMFFNLRWFGHPLGALPLLTGANADIHEIRTTFRLPGEGLAGLLISPSRGILVFSPVILIALAAVPRALRAGTPSPVFWCLLAAIAQFGVYATYSVWWGGHTYGPRYMLDILPLLVPLAAATLSANSRIWRPIAIPLFVWSVVVAATGAFCYPNDAWNSRPTDIDRDHARLWSISDNQIWRCWTAGPSPQNFALFKHPPVRGLRP